MNEQQFKEALSHKGIGLSDGQLSQFRQYYETLVDWNGRMNLTAITAKADVYLKHFYDSLSVAFYFDFQQQLKIIDVGAGAGFPSIPLKICFPHLDVSIVDSLNKRITFLNALAEELEMTGVTFYHDRAEDFGHKPEHREQYDVSLARAVARLPVLAEFCLPLVKKDGSFIAMKGAGAEEERQDAKKAVAVLGGETSTIHPFHLPKEEGERSIIVISKTKATPKKYPRKPGVPAKKPL
ncbi:16S rRNA (guanine527-N7)-methyltransferase [Evansella caseinilytica]|uniref:Ribosomal RNA small subunit methyltransferase G n=1 Tax=Evansella caseinilytica TaxID=1503961 RepID=A0A1H3UTL9_9BACI|nr:16S rRNA (guanine(527)-N(7))-methyltransferase RsmG [Evansella caseinilytica]SDZ65139.1 16S rRNA (guanine527-N7)-methyltransferase [Evansella caseinilytica]